MTKRIDIVKLFATPKQISVAAEETKVAIPTIIRRMEEAKRNGYEIVKKRYGIHVLYTIRKRGTNESQNHNYFTVLMDRFGMKFEAELQFCPSRKWRFDFADRADMIAVEVEGGVWTNGRHTRPVGFLGDIEKYNTATAMGWRVLRTTPKQLVSDEFVELVKLMKK